MFKKLVPLVVILAVLCGLALIRKGGKEQPTLAEEVNLKALVPDDLRSGDIVRLELFAGPAPDEKVTLERSDGAWRVASHFNAPVKEDAINEFLDKLTNLKGEFRANADTDAKRGDYDLTGGTAFHVRAFKKDAAEPAMDVLFGKAPDYKTVFVRNAGGDPVYIESKNLRSEAGVYGESRETAPKADKWLDKDILTLAEGTITKVALRLPDKAMTFERRVKPVEKEDPEGETEAPAVPVAAAPEYEWVCVSGGFTPAYEQASFNNLLRKFTSLLANNVVDPATKEAWGLASPAFACTISREDGDDIVLEGGRPGNTGSGYLRLASGSADIVYEVSSYNFEQLFPKGSALFTLPALTLDQSGISRIVIDQPEGRVVLAKKDDEWEVLEPAENLPVQSTGVKALVSTLSNWKPADYADPGTDTGARSRSISVTAGEITRTLTFLGDAKAIDGAYVKLDGDDTLFAMGRTDMAKVLLEARDVYTLTPLDIDEDEVTRVEAAYDGKTLDLEKNNGAWTQTVDGKAKPVARDACEDIIASLAEFQVADFHFGKREPDWTPYLSVKLVLADGAEHLLNVAPEVDGRHLLELSGKQHLFESEAGGIEEIAAQIAALTKPAPGPEASEAEAPEADAAAAPATGPVTESASQPLIGGSPGETP